VVVVVIVVVALLVIGLVAVGLFAEQVVHSFVPKTVVIVSGGTSWNLNPGSYQEQGPIDLSASSSWTVSGSFTATLGGITVYAMSSGDYAAWGGVGTPPLYDWTSGANTQVGDIDAQLSAGSYYFVWDNTNSTSPSFVQVTSTVEAISAP
jgi:hypothetical protein